MNCLYDMTYDELKELVEDVLHLEYWCVRDDELRNRMDSIAYIKKVKLRKSILNKGYGTIKLYVKKGLSLNYHIEDIPNPEEIYNLIMENIKINSNEQGR